MSLTDTPRANRLHIGIFGKRNSGKSSLINALTRQETALVSDVAGTTADPVYKSMEIYGIGPCVFIDTAGFDDVGELGQMRVDKTKKVKTLRRKSAGQKPCASIKFRSSPSSTRPIFLPTRLKSPRRYGKPAS